MALEPDGSRPPRSETNDLLWMAYRIRESYLEGLKQAREMLIGSPFLEDGKSHGNSSKEKEFV